MLLRKRNRCTSFRICATLFVVVLIIYFNYLFPELNPLAPTSPPAAQPRVVRHLSKALTVVFRQFEEFENDIADSVQSFALAFPHMPVVVVTKSTPYPPFPFSVTNETLKNVKVVSLELKLSASPQDLDPLSHIFTDYVLFVPDSTRVSKRVLQQALAVMTTESVNAVAVGVGSSAPTCLKINWSYTDWTLQYSKQSDQKLCDAVKGPHVLMISTAILKTLPEPLILPFPESLYLQTSAKKIKIKHFQSGRLAAGRSVLKSPISKQRAARYARERRVSLYKQLGIKAAVKEDGHVQWYGCRKETQRCFPTVQGTPSYILAGRNTPPCCRRNIRRTVNHVLKMLLSVGARCWLETTSLLGAIVKHDILPWAEYAEIGIHAADVQRFAWLNRGGADTEGFVWERATKGRYYRVAYSATNRVYALILPFVPKNGTMWPDDWVLAHQKEFPERHLHPLAQITFAGQSAPAPNDARAFLDLKLGHNSVERCQKLGPKLFYP